jgi:hypothetical protein
MGRPRHPADGRPQAESRDACQQSHSRTFRSATDLAANAEAKMMP